MATRNARIKVSPRVSAATIAAARPLVGVTHAATLGWDRALVIRGAAGAVPLVLDRSAAELRGRSLAEVFERPESLADALAFGTARSMHLRSGRNVRVEAGPCPGGAVAVIRRPSSNEIDLGDLASSLGHELRNAFASVILAVQSISRTEEVASERGKRRLHLAERELRRIECLLRGLAEVGREQVLRLVATNPERLVAEALENLGPLENEKIKVTLPDGDGPSAQLDAPRVCLAVEEMLRDGARRLSAGGELQAQIERRLDELAVVILASGPGAEPPANDVPDIGLAVIQGVARAHGGHVERAATEHGTTLSLIIPQRRIAP